MEIVKVREQDAEEERIDPNVRGIDVGFVLKPRLNVEIQAKRQQRDSQHEEELRKPPERIARAAVDGRQQQQEQGEAKVEMFLDRERPSVVPHRRPVVLDEEKFA